MSTTAAFDELAAYYADIFGNGRNAYAIPPGALTDPVKQRQMAAFFWWTAWAASTNRPGMDVSYTQNWPHEPLIGNQPTSGAVVWSIVSFVMLLGGVGGMVWYFASQPREGVAGPDRGAQAVGDLLQQVVPRVVAETVVHLLEAVEVD